ncbi:MAG: VOC family protein [Nanoarchaeota archaeon]|mgnify:CR=1 FL=1
MEKKINWRISHVNLYSEDYSKLIRFYRDVIGMNPLKGMNEKDNWYGFDTGKTTFALEPVSNRKRYTWEYNTKNPVLVQFQAHDEDELEAMNQQLEKKGVKLLTRSEQRSYGKITIFLDPDGNFLEILLPSQK